MRKKKILLLFPQFNKYGFGGEWEEMESIMPPIGLLYLATPLMKKGYDVEYLDLNVEKLEKKEFLQKTLEKDYILITCYTDPLKITEHLIKDIRKANKKSIIICGGPHCTLFKKVFKGADYTVIGEAEQLIAELLDSIDKKKILSKFPGLIYKKNKKWVVNKGFMCVKDLDASDSPCLDIAPMEKYGRIADLKFKIAPVMSSRGCPYRCTYCTFKITTYRERSVNNVFKEIKKLKEAGYDYFFFCDDNLLLKKKRIHNLLDKIIKEKLKIKFILQARVDTADEELYKKLRKAGAMLILFGIENANQDVLDFYNKGVKVEQIENAVNLANKYGILTVGFMMFGSPLETEKHFNTNKEFFRRVPLDFTTAGVLIYNKGTRLWDDAVKKGLIQKNEIVVKSNKSLSNYTLEQLKEAKEDFVKDFYSNPARIIRILYKGFKQGLLLKLLSAFSRNKVFKYSTSPYKKDVSVLIKE